MHLWEIKRVEIIHSAVRRLWHEEPFYVHAQATERSSLSGATITFPEKISYGVKILARVAHRPLQGPYTVLRYRYLFIYWCNMDAASFPNNSPEQYLCVLENSKGKMDNFSRYKS